MGDGVPGLRIAPLQERAGIGTYLLDLAVLLALGPLGTLLRAALRSVPSLPTLFRLRCPSQPRLQPELIVARLSNSFYAPFIFGCVGPCIISSVHLPKVTGAMMIALNSRFPGRAQVFTTTGAARCEFVFLRHFFETFPTEGMPTLRRS